MARLVQIRLRIGGSEQCCTAILGERGRKFTPLVTVEFPIRVRKVPNELVDRSTRDIEGCTLAQAVRRYRKIGREHGITKGATRFLKEVRP